MKRTTIDYDSLAMSAPINRVSVRVARNRDGEQYAEPSLDPDAMHWENCPVLIQIEEISHPKGRVTAAKMMGFKFGRLTVVGLYKERTDTEFAKWAVRCTCGDYEVREYSQIFDHTNTNDMCSDCRHFEDIKQRYREEGPIR